MKRFNVFSCHFFSRQRAVSLLFLLPHQLFCFLTSSKKKRATANLWFSDFFTFLFIVLLLFSASSLLSFMVMFTVNHSSIWQLLLQNWIHCMLKLKLIGESCMMTKRTNYSITFCFLPFSFTWFLLLAQWLSCTLSTRSSTTGFPAAWNTFCPLHRRAQG